MEDNEEEAMDFVVSQWKDTLERAKEQFNVELSAEQLANTFSSVETWAIDEGKGKKKKKKTTKRRRLNEQNVHEEQVSSFMIDSRTLEEKVFGNHLLSTKIFGHLKKPDLLNCRLVHPRWKESIVIGKNGDGIVFSKQMYRFFLKGSNWKSLDMFTEFLKYYSDDSYTFPCVGFEFKGANIGNHDAQRFFEFFGSSIRNLKVDMEGQTGRWRDTNFSKIPKSGFNRYWTNPRDIGKLLSRQAPNLQELTIRFPSLSSWPGYQKLFFNIEAPKETKLPNLTTIKYHPAHSHNNNIVRGETDSAILTQLLRAANNLKKFELVDGNLSIGKYLGIIVSTGKFNTIKNVMFTPNDENEISSFQKFAAFQPQLEKLSLNLEKINGNPQIWSKVSSVLSILCKTSQYSLKTMNFLGSLGFLPFITLPQFENVNRIKLKVTQIRGNNKNTNNPANTNNNSNKDQDGEENAGDKDVVNQVDNSSLFLPPGVNFSDTFPALHFVEIDVTVNLPEAEGLPSWAKFFPMDDSLPTVKILEITPRAIPTFWIEKFGEMFPNLEKLTLREVRDFPAVAAIIWSSYQQLTHLKVELKMDTVANSGRVLDLAFTGFTEEQLGKSVKLPSKKKATSPSILEMKNLKRIRLEFNCHKLQKMGNYQVLCQNVGKDYLNKLKSLPKVTISVRCSICLAKKITAYKNALKALAKYNVKVLKK